MPRFVVGHTLEVAFFLVLQIIATNLFVLNITFVYPLKASGHCKVFSSFQRV